MLAVLLLHVFHLSHLPLINSFFSWLSRAKRLSTLYSLIAWMQKYAFLMNIYALIFFHRCTGNATCQCPREHTNTVSSILDANTVYGSTEERSRLLRTLKDGLMKTDNGNLPVSCIFCFLSSSNSHHLYIYLWDHLNALINTYIISTFLKKLYCCAAQKSTVLNRQTFESFVLISIAHSLRKQHKFYVVLVAYFSSP